MATATMEVQSAAMQFSDDRDMHRHDLRIILGRKSQMVGTSEIDTPEFREDCRLVAKEKGYRFCCPKDPITGKHTHEPIFIRNDLEFKSMVFEQIIPPGSIGGRHGPRGLTTVRAKWLNNHVSLTWAHWLTDWDNEYRQKQNMKLLRAMSTRVQLEGLGNRLAWWGGDINWDIDDPTFNTPGQMLRERGLVTVFNELHKPDLPTHGSRQIDLIGSYRNDRRVQAVGVEVFKDTKQFSFTDHAQVVATYKVVQL
jgi:hypothetical protein